MGMMRRLQAGLAAAVMGATPVTVACSQPTTIRTLPGQTFADAVRQMRTAPAIAAWVASHPRPKTGVSPRLTSGALVSSVVKIGGTSAFPVIQFAFQTGPAGLVFAEFTFTSPSGAQTFSVNYFQANHVMKGNVTWLAGAAFPAFSEPGTWTLTAATIFDYSGLSATYDAKQLAVLFRPATLTVLNNGPVDSAPPSVASALILTPTVSLSSPLPQFRAKLGVTDNLSGVVYAVVAISPPKGGSLQADFVPPPRPIVSGDYYTYSTIYPGQPTGTWTIAEYIACDLAFNCFEDGDAYDIQNLFGSNTFVVKK